MIYSKVLNVGDYETLPTAFVNSTQEKFKKICRFEHEHRCWEYGLAIKALLDNKTEKVLSVGGGGSVLVPLVYLSKMDVTEVDFWDGTETLNKQAAMLGSSSIRYFQQDFLDFELDEEFDAVVCTSVIEHVREHEKFFLKLLDYVISGGLLVLTTDFHPSSKAFSNNHIRTYSEDDLLEYAELAKGFTFYGDDYDYTYWGNYVYQYSFGSLVLKNG
jgi:2-polyprenyl-3-methyl-5-hydroxy-6-metoxy-1,4-benzoquinol methylase